MEEELNGSSDPIFIPENHIRSVQANITAQLERLRVPPNETFVEISFVCDNVRDQILNFRDEPHLSETQNNYRRIFIASELFISLCSIYANNVDYECGKIITDLMEWDKYKKLSKRINFKMQLALKKEKYFMKEAQKRLLKNEEDAAVEEMNEVVRTPREEPEGEVDRHERRNSQINQEIVEGIVEEEKEAIPELHVNDTLAPPLENSFRDEFPSSIFGNLTEIRDDIMVDTFDLDLTRQDLVLPVNENSAAEISIGQPTVQQKPDDEVDKILQILDDIFPENTPEIEQPANVVEPPVERAKETTESATENATKDNQTSALESSEGWSLPSLEEMEKTKKKPRHLIIDNATFIPDYASRALQLNRNIEIQRVQVFEGPPTLLQTISVNHLMTTPGYNTRSVRSSRLSTLYNRHLEVEKKTVETRIQLKRKAEEQREVEISKVRTNGAFPEILQDVETRTGMRPMHEKSDILAEALEPIRLQEKTSIGGPPDENLVGIPVSRIINSTIEPPEETQMNRINAAPILPTPRVQHLQGKTLDPKTSPPWFFSPKENPPSAKYRSFSYVYEKLQKYWSLLESQGTEKCVTIREFLSFDADASPADFLTVLRVLDKMSIQRKLVLEYKNGDVFILPFEVPFVSNAQFELKEKELVF